MTFASLRADLDRSGFTSQFVGLPGDVVDRPPLEGALRVEQSALGFELQSVDYGQARTVARATDEEEASELVRSDLRRPISEPRSITTEELTELRRSSERYLPELADRIRSSGGQVLIQLPPAIPVDRVGGPDGWLLNPFGAPFESRSLPPSALSLPSTVHPYVTEGDVLVHAQITLPWFGQPGGALRFSIADESVTIRDLLVSGALRRITVGR
ncbi:TNT domain-containing protein [Curtobacterium sp. 'Ferrero']|uniref:TNT domain-containing protein n=1 Tax=Curtobacterium sp. 'Ferrero' TaxID=2033654 RepID=UPI001596E935|nr:TNT domain-containing protein [Curtobacterium sp. 'Ferrero']